MRLICYALAAALLAVTVAPAGAQLRANRPPPRTQNNPRLMVANPYPANSADSAAAVQIGDGMRKEMNDIAGRWFNMITREQMNDALLQYAYPPDAVLTPSVARTLATQLQARFVVSSTLNRTEGGRYAVQVRAIGMNDKAGFTTSVVQQPSQGLEAFGEAAAKTLEGAFRALEDARECWNEQTTKPREAASAGQKALRTQPDHGLAAYCLGEIAKARNAPPDSLLAYYGAATKGDAQSLEAWSELLILYQQMGDSAKTVETLQHMLRVAPTNQPLREQAFKLFLQYGRANAAKEVAEEGLEIDSTNAGLWDLKSNACLFLEDYTCAVDALEQVFEVDSARADTAFFNKINAVAAAASDTARLLKWSQRAIQRFPDSPTMLAHLVTAYSMAGPVDSALATTRRLMAVDSTDLRPVLRVIQLMAAEKRLDSALTLGEHIERRGDASDKQNYALILTNQGALPLLREQPQDLVAAARFAKKAVEIAPPGGQVSVVSHYILGLALALQVQQRDAAVMEQKSCEMARESQTMLTEAEQALNTGQSANPQAVGQYLQLVQGFRPRVESQIKAFCR